MVVMVIKNGITGKLNNCLFVLYRNYTKKQTAEFGLYQMYKHSASPRVIDLI